MIKISWNRAKWIQDWQLVFYRHRIGRAGVKKIRSMTHCPETLDPNEPIDIVEINQLVPRGGAFENLIAKKPYRHPKTTNHLAYEFATAMQNGKLYN